LSISPNDKTTVDCSVSRGNLYDFSRDGSAKPIVPGPNGNDSSIRDETYQSTDWNTWKSMNTSFISNGLISNMSFGYFNQNRSASVMAPIMAANSRTFSWVGLLGIHGVTTDLSPGSEGGSSSQQLSLMQGLFKAGWIKSLSYAYTAGCYNRPEGFGSLIFGGYDRNKILGSNNTIDRMAKFGFSADSEKPLVADVKSIRFDGGIGIIPNKTYLDKSYTYDFSGPTYSDGAPAQARFILDSTQPYLYLPQEFCDRLASAFDLQYDDNPQSPRYLISDDAHTRLMNSDASLTFTFKSHRGAHNDSELMIKMNYPSLNLFNGAPLGKGVAPYTRYMPIRPASPISYALGRAFFQDAYIIADYGEKEFSISQVNWAADSQQKAITLIQPHADSSKDFSRRNQLPIILVICILTLLILGLSVWWFVRRRNRRRVQKGLPKMAEPLSPLSTIPTLADNASSLGSGTTNEIHQMAEVSPVQGTLLTLHGTLSTAELGENSIIELPTSPSNEPKELPLTEIYELEGTDKLHELDGTGKSCESKINMTTSTNNHPSTVGMVPLRLTVPPISKSSAAIQARLRGENLALASPIPQTPAEYYGRVAAPQSFPADVKHEQPLPASGEDRK
jgi:hypothetical protein